MTPEVAERAAGLFGVRAGWLLFGEGDPPADLAHAHEQGRRAGWHEAVAALVAAAPKLVTPDAASDLDDPAALAEMADAATAEEAPQEQERERGKRRRRSG